MNRRPAAGLRCKSRGFTLLEILVALVVLSVGLLGLAGLQTFSLRNNHSAFLRSQATVFAYDALDRMRSNRAQALLGTGSAYNYETNPDDTTPGETTPGETTPDPSSPEYCSSNCTSAQIAQNDLTAWKAEVERLPSGEGQISVDANNKARVEVRWSDNRDDNLLTVAVETLL